MSESKGGLDLGGLGKIAEAIPREGWNKIIDTAAETFSDLIAPITKTTAGLGGLIQGKFDAMIDVQKVFAADAVYRARLKCEQVGGEPNPRPSARVVIDAIEEASVESDDNLREIWSNLLANELTSGGVHPEFPKILARMSADDAHLLSSVTSDSKSNLNRKLANKVTAEIIHAFGISVGLSWKRSKSSFSIEHLERLGLIREADGEIALTKFGEQFVRAVSDPSLFKAR